MERCIKIGSTISNIQEVELFLNSIFDEYEIDSNRYSKIYLSLSEAFNNAIQHGNKLDESKYVTISFSVSSNYYEFTIEDEGIGFSLDSLKDPTTVENIRNESGRGIFIMTRFSDNIEILEKGNKIKLNFYKSD
jgi:serine/threonine-protein kinase RsbW